MTFFPEMIQSHKSLTFSFIAFKYTKHFDAQSNKFLFNFISFLTNKQKCFTGIYNLNKYEDVEVFFTQRPLKHTSYMYSKRKTRVTQET